jgi:hypothetical protein
MARIGLSCHCWSCLLVSLFQVGLFFVFQALLVCGWLRWLLPVGSSLRLSLEFVCVEGVSVLRVYERSRGLVQSISMGKVTVSWLLDTVRALLQVDSSKEFVKSSRVGVKDFIAYMV